MSTGRVKIEFEDRSGQYGDDVNQTFNSIGDAMNVLRTITTQYRYNNGKAQKFDRLSHREPVTPDKLRKTDRTGRKGTISGAHSNDLKYSIQNNKGKLGPKGVLPEGQGVAEGDGDEAYVACIVQFNRSGRAMVQRTKPISHERAEEVIRNALAKNTFVHPPFMTIYPASAGKLDGSTIMAQFPDMSQKGLAEGKADYNFDIEDLKRLERIRDLPTLKTQAMALISKPSVKPMKPEKVEWFKNALDNQRMNSPMKVIKLMYDLLLSGEGNAVVGTRSSMNPNSYRQRFGEQGVEEGWGMGGYATAIGSEIQPGKGHEMGENDEYDGEGSMIKNDLHTIVRVSTHLAKALTDDENLPTWVIEKIAQTKGMIVSVMDYMISQHEMGQVYQKENHPDEKEDKALIRKMVKQQALKQETNDPYMAELHAQLAEKIPKNAPVKTYIDDFAKASKTPNAKGHHQFKNKSPEKVRQMAIAASYGAKNPSKKKK